MNQAIDRGVGARTRAGTAVVVAAVAGIDTGVGVAAAAGIGPGFGIMVEIVAENYIVVAEEGTGIGPGEETTMIRAIWIGRMADADNKNDKFVVVEFR